MPVSSQAIGIAARFPEHMDPAVRREPKDSVGWNIAKEETLFLLEPDRAFGKLKARCNAFNNGLREESGKIFRPSIQALRL